MYQEFEWTKDVFILHCTCNPPSSAPSHRAGLEPGIPVREAGALPRRLKATASSVNRQSASFWGQESEVYTQPLLAYTSVTLTPLNLTPIRITAPIITPSRVHTILTRSCSERVSNPGFQRGRQAL